MVKRKNRLPGSRVGRSRPIVRRYPFPLPPFLPYYPKQKSPPLIQVRMSKKFFSPTLFAATILTLLTAAGGAVPARVLPMGTVDFTRNEVAHRPG